MDKIRIIALTATIAIFGCATTNKYPERALVEPKLVTSSIDLEKQLAKRESVPLPDGKNWYEVIEGKSPVIITAPHSTRPLREGKRRFSDGGGTAALAVALGELTGATVIYTTYEGPSDPNYYDENDFKNELARLISEKRPVFVLDIHGSHPYRSYDIDLGTMKGKSLLGNEEMLFSLIERLNSEGIHSISYNRFGASKYESITKFSSNKGVPAIQLEVNAIYVSPSAGNIEAQQFSKLLQALARFINEIVSK